LQLRRLLLRLLLLVLQPREGFSAFLSMAYNQPN
jgi:hypothetical protein